VAAAAAAAALLARIDRRVVVYTCLQDLHTLDNHGIAGGTLSVCLCSLHSHSLRLRQLHHQKTVCVCVYTFIHYPSKN